jgi:Cytotoxic translational repressor of toxin-antitoxin stability system
MWRVAYLREAVNDLKKLDNSQRLQVIKAIEKVSLNSLPQSEGGLGKSLGNMNNSKLAGYLKIKLKKLGLRIIYRLVIEDGVMKIIIISARADDEVYITAQIRIK